MDSKGGNRLSSNKVLVLPVIRVAVALAIERKSFLCF
jgi:hypothetical protein